MGEQPTIVEKEFYKNCPPEETICRIRNILHKVGVLVTESSGQEGGFYHSHLKISNNKMHHFNMITNGKGRSPEYALASAYSEMTPCLIGFSTTISSVVLPVIRLAFAPTAIIFFSFCS